MITNTTLSELCSRVRGFIREPAPRGDQPFNQLALDLFRFQFAHNPAYRRFCERTGSTPETISVWKEIPAIPASGFKELELTVLSPADRTIVFHSSGTTGHRPSRHFHSSETLRVYEESLLAWFQPNVLAGAEEVDFLLLSPPPVDAPHSSLAHMFKTISARSVANDRAFVGVRTEDGSWELEPEALEARVHRFTRSDLPVVICGTAFSFVHWCDALEGQGRRLAFPRGSRVFETGGYKGKSRAVSKPELHFLIQEKLGIPSSHLVSEYGMSELSSQAYDRVIGTDTPRLLQFPPWARAVIISPETGREVRDGETGLVRIYDLANVGSVLAIQTEDLATRRDPGFELIGRGALAEPRGCSLLEISS